MAYASAQSGNESPYLNTSQQNEVRSNSVRYVHCNNRELLRVRSSRLAGFFRDEVVIQEKTVSVIHSSFLSSYVETLPIQDVGRVIEFNTLFLCGLRILGKNPEHDMHVRGLHKNDVIRCKLLIEGLLLEDRGEVEVPRSLSPQIRSEVLADAAQAPDDSR